MPKRTWDAKQQPDNLDRFDPLKISDWSLPMTLMWIIWRDIDRVRSQYELYDWYLRDANRIEDADEAIGSTLLPTKLKYLHDILLETGELDLPQKFLVPGPTARDDLWLKLGTAKLVASGQDIRSEGRTIIDQTEWQDLDSFDPGLDWPFDAVGNGHDQELRYKKVTVSVETVVNLWPARQATEGISDFARHEDRTPPVSWQEANLKTKIRPHDEMFDPDKLSHWSIVMTMAWIIWGDIDLVRENWDDYRSQCVEWKFFEEINLDSKAHELAIKNATLHEPAPNDPEIRVLNKTTEGRWEFVAWSDAGWLGLEFTTRRDEIPWEQMVEALWLAAGEGKIQATALEFLVGETKGKVVEIPPNIWARLRRTRESSGKAMLSASDRDYRDVRFARLVVKKFWPLKRTTNQSDKDSVVVASKQIGEPTSQASSDQIAISYSTSGKGARGKACEHFYEKFFPDGLPPGGSATQRNSRIENAVIEAGLPKPDKRTIERAVAKVETRKGRRL